MKTKYTFELYRDKKQEFRWRLKSRNGRIIADCAESYKRRYTMWKIIQDIISYSGDYFKINDLTTQQKWIQG